MAIGVFDSGYGGLTILKGLRHVLPEYDYLYLGDNARAPYGTRSFPVVYEYTRQAVRHLFNAGCPLVILACNTASAKALRNLQQEYLPTSSDPSRRVLGVIRPTVEVVPEMSGTGHIGVLATPGTIASDSYRLELRKLDPTLTVTQLAAPMWVSLVENGEAGDPGADYFVRKYIDNIMHADPLIDTLVLACTHYPILEPKIRRYLPDRVRLVTQGELTGASLKDYLRRHPEMDSRLNRGGECRFLTTEQTEKFDDIATLFTGHDVHSTRVELNDNI